MDGVHTTWIVTAVDKTELCYLCIGDIVDCSAGDDGKDVAKEEDIFPESWTATAYADPEGAEAHACEGECDAVHGGGDDGALQPCSLGQELAGSLVGGIGRHGGRGGTRREDARTSIGVS